MTDPLRLEGDGATAELTERDREARVEELLLTGLDYYFAGQHDRAINVWTRVLFLDRGHARARAYIERARSAVAERLREAEELIHTGAAAFQRGESDAARRLLTTAVERGAVTEEALALLGRLDRLEAAGVQQESRAEPRPVRAPIAGELPERALANRSWLGWIATGAVLGMAGVVIVMALLSARGTDWLGLGAGETAATATRAVDEPLPVPSAADVCLARAKALHARGRLREALAALDPIRPGDPLRVEADRERATIQQKLLAAGRAGLTAVPRPPGAQDAPRQ